MAIFVAVVLVLARVSDALTVHRAGWARSANHAWLTDAPKGPTTFSAYYEKASGRGIWKWNNALHAYDRHFGMLAGKKLSIAEVGVQSGGSLLMWRGVLGQQIMMHGLDINPNCKQFEGTNVSITIGDQGDWAMWQGFFAKVSTGLDILVDDGGHEPHQMVTTLQAAFPHVHYGGYVAIEDITVCPHCPPYLETFFKPSATFLSQQADAGLVDSVHLYPMLMVVRKGGFKPDSPQAAEGVLNYSSKKVTVTDLTQMWTQISSAPAGSQIFLQNPSWTNLFHVDALSNFFTAFISLSDGAFTDTPDGCSTTKEAVCTNEIKPLNHLQSRVSGVHIFKDHAVIEIPSQPPRIAAVRKGTKWIGYGL